jgi:hypothetical protein
MTYGLPYKGSKNKIASWVVSHFPQKTNFYDLFCGGCAITHKCLEENKFENYIINDIDKLITQLFMDCVNGEIDENKYTKWVSREDFFLLKETDPIVRYCWSFGNKGTTYLYGRDRERLKYCVHTAIVDGNYDLLLNEYNIDLCPLEGIEDVNERRLLTKKIIRDRKTHDLQHIENLMRIQHLEGLLRVFFDFVSYKDRSITAFNKDYSDIEIKSDSLIYCDIPYKGTDPYNKIGFDYERFYNWCSKQTELVVISEYSMPEDRFECIDSINKRVTMSKDDNTLLRTERLFVPKHQTVMLQGI